MNNHRRIASCPLILAIGLASPLSYAASVYNEIGDAGQTFNTALTITPDTTSIVGSIDPDSDVDMYSFNWTGGQFTADTLQSNFDTALYLFSSSGLGLYKNDDGFNYFGPSQISTTLSSGNYFLAVSTWDMNAMDSDNSFIFPESNPTNYSSLLTPITANAMLDHFGAEFPSNGGSYQINISARVDTPQTILLIGLGLLAFRLTQQRKFS